MFYSILGGMTSIVIGDVVKYTIMSAAAIAVAIIAAQHLALKPLDVSHGWLSPFFGWTLEDLNWTGIIDEVNAKIQSDGFTLFTIFFMMMLFNVIGRA